jgi:integrase
MGQGSRPAVSKRLPFLKSYKDRHGKVRHYLRQPGAVAVAIPGEYGSKEFIDAYWDARENAVPRQIGADRIIPRSVAALIVAYYKSRDFTGLQAQTRSTYRNTLEKIREQHGTKLVSGIRQRHVAAMLNGLETNEQNWRRMLRIILRIALERGWIDVHPMAEMRRPRKALRGFRAWEATEIAAFESRWPTGSRERLAFALLLYTGQRRSDMVTMGRQHVTADRISVVQQKTGTRLAIKLHAKLQSELAMVPKTQLTFLQTQYGEPFRAAGFTNWFLTVTKAAGLSECTAHGLRKTAAAHLAEAGCTGKEIMAITGHANLSEVTLYTAGADQVRLADEAMRKLEKRTNRLPAPKPVRQQGA